MKKLSWEDYFNRTVSVGMQFTLARDVISTFKDTPEALQKYSEKELIDLRELLKESFEKSGWNNFHNGAYHEQKENSL